jgi:hypothetical protein
MLKGHLPYQDCPDGLYLGVRRHRQLGEERRAWAAFILSSSINVSSIAADWLRDTTYVHLNV